MFHPKEQVYFTRFWGVQRGGVPFNYKGARDESWDTSKCDILCDITNIPVEDKSFDLIMLFEVIEHLPEPVEAVKELTRVLREGGLLVITAPNFCAPHQRPYFYYSGFSTEFFERAVLSKCPNLSPEIIALEGDFITAHLGELKSLVHQQNNKINRVITFFTVNLFCFVMWLISKRLRDYVQPESGSGFFIVYRKLSEDAHNKYE